MLVNVHPYHPNWPNDFLSESKKIKAILGDLLIDIHHIGSTAVPNLMAKPIIDMMPEVSDLDLLDTKSKAFEDLGYEVMGELGILGRRYYRKGGDNRTHQIHAFKTGDVSLVRHLAFRDYLIAHPIIAKEYGDLKFQIAQHCNHDIEQYCDEKDPFVQYHEKLALVWYEETLRS